MSRMIFAITLVLAMPLSMRADPPPGEQDLVDQVRQLQAQVQDLRHAESEIRGLREEVRELRDESSSSRMSQRRAEEIKGLIREVLADADTRASMLEGGPTAGHNGRKFFLASDDGSFLLNIEGQIQIRYVANFRDSSGTDDTETGFQLRRTKMKFSGHIANPRLKYVFQFEVDRNSQQIFADIITIGYDLTDDLYLWVGEDKGPFLREEMVSSKRQLAVERSLVNEVFTLDVIQGVGFKWDAHERIKVAGVFSDGARSGDSGGDDRVLEDIDPAPGEEGFTDDPDDPGKDFQGDATDFALTGRVEFLLAGDWKQAKDFTSWADEGFFAMFGAAIHYEMDETGDSTPNDELLMWTVDGAIECHGFNVYSSFVMAHTDYEDRSDFTPWGVVVQGGYNIPLNGTSIEPFVRYEHIDMDDVDIDDQDAFDLVTFGFNWYHHKHAAKLSLDVVWALDPLPEDLKGLSDGLGLLPDATDEDDQVALRIQYQLLF